MFNMTILIDLACFALAAYIAATVVSVIILNVTSYKTLKDGF